MTDEELIRLRRLREKNGLMRGQGMVDQPIFDYSTDSGDLGSSQTNVASGAQKGASSAAIAAANGGSASDIASAGLMASGNPSALGAGTVLAVLSANSKRKEKEYETRQMLKQKRIERQQNAINKMITVAQGLRNL